MTSLSELGKKKAAAPAPAPAEDPGLDFGASEVATPQATAAMFTQDYAKAARNVVEHPQIEVEAVIGGCLMRLHIADMSPVQVLPYLKSLDPACKVRDDFPAKGGGAFGKRETKRARLSAVMLKASPNGVFIDLLCKAEKGVSVSVSKKTSDTFIASLAATGKIHDENIEALQAAVDTKTTATVMLESDETVDVEYWTMEDGKSFMEALHAAAAE